MKIRSTVERTKRANQMAYLVRAKVKLITIFGGRSKYTYILYGVKHSGTILGRMASLGLKLLTLLDKECIVLTRTGLRKLDRLKVEIGLQTSVASLFSPSTTASMRMTAIVRLIEIYPFGMDYGKCPPSEGWKREADRLFSDLHYETSKSAAILHRFEYELPDSSCLVLVCDMEIGSVTVTNRNNDSVVFVGRVEEDYDPMHTFTSSMVCVARKGTACYLFRMRSPNTLEQDALLAARRASAA